MKLMRYYEPGTGVQVGVQNGESIYNVTDHVASVSVWLQRSVGRVHQEIDVLAQLIRTRMPAYSIEQLNNPPKPNLPHWVAPVDDQDVWAAGVTYERSREARQEEAQDGGDVYARVYDANRPELFFKAHGRAVVGHLDTVGIRRDATWNVPEPELAVVFNPALEAIGFTAGNDMSSRDIEGENPLYLPQAKVYRRSCALGNAITLTPSDHWKLTTIRIQIDRGGETVFSGDVHTGRIKRRLPELADFLGRSQDFPTGVVLLTGTGVVPAGEFTLEAGDVVAITIDDVATLTNTVEVV